MHTFRFAIGTDNGVFTISVLASDVEGARDKVASLVYGKATIDEIMPLA